eukprot:g10348.t1
MGPLQPRRAYDLGDLVFKAQACEIWGLSPDLFADPEVWFDYWDVNKDGHLSPEELIPALTAAYEVGDLGKQWIESYVNTHYREMAALDPNALLTKSAFLGNDGLLHKLQSSEEFISLRGQEDSPRMNMPALFRTEGRKKPTAADKEAVNVFSARLEELRKKFGWEHGKSAPSCSRLLELPPPYPGGDIDPERRLKAAQRMLAVIPPEMFLGAPVDIFQWLLLGNAQISDAQMSKLEQIIIPEGLVPKHLKDQAEVRDSARWVFDIIHRSDDNFRSRLFEFWTGNGRLPLGGVEAIEPKPRLQVMVSQEKQYIPVDYVWEVQIPGGWRAYGQQMMCEFQMGPNKIVIDLGAGLQINSRTNERRRIRRRPLQQPQPDSLPVIVKRTAYHCHQSGPLKCRHAARIDSWPKTRLPEGHTCGNELWIPLCDSEEELATDSGCLMHICSYAMVWNSHGFFHFTLWGLRFCLVSRFALGSMTERQSKHVSLQIDAQAAPKALMRQEADSTFPT